MRIRCRDEACAFRRRPARLLVDEDIYRYRPTCHRDRGQVRHHAVAPETAALFNRGSDSPPPELIIQDELHLISGPLGTLAGLYETAIDFLCTDNGRPPKVVASTATIRRAQHQTAGPVRAQDAPVPAAWASTHAIPGSPSRPRPRRKGRGCTSG